MKITISAAYPAAINCICFRHCFGYKGVAQRQIFSFDYMFLFSNFSIFNNFSKHIGSRTLTYIPYNLNNSTVHQSIDVFNLILFLTISFTLVLF
jgi:hypothetical protein